VIATLLTLPLLTAMTDFMGLLGGCVASVFSLRLSAIEFWRRAIDALDFADLMQGFTKPFFFAFILATIGCYKGLTVRGGTQGVGRATTQAAVLSSVMIIVADAFLTKVVLMRTESRRPGCGRGAFRVRRDGRIAAIMAGIPDAKRQPNNYPLQPSHHL
jgi:ABC-type transporter Mla maintaining outer membrane lipid asymmetry permease subunit MlaE